MTVHAFRDGHMPKTIYSQEYRQLLGDLRKHREAIGFTQKQVAKALRWKQNTFSTIETGGRRLDVIEYIKLARVLGLSPADAFELAERRVRRPPRPPGRPKRARD